jgi:RNA recognition motif-containing protein
MNIQITNLNLNLIESDLQRLFTPFGEISSVCITRDKFSNRSKGSAFIDMPVGKEAENAITNLHGRLFAGKIIKVSSAAGSNESDINHTNFIK